MQTLALEDTAEQVKEEQEQKNDNKRIKKHHGALFVQLWVCIGLILAAAALEITAVLSTGFSDWYREYIFPVWVNTYGRLTSLFPFSVGEILIMLAVFGIPVSLLVMGVLLFFKKGRRRRIAKIFGIVYLWIVTFVVVVQVNNCFVLYRTSTISQKYDIPENEHTNAQLEALGYAIIDELNDAAKKVERDDKGRVVMKCDFDETARKAVQALGDEFDLLKGHYVSPKPIMCSFFMSQMDLTGIFFPFSMEANYNNDMYKAKLPCTVCHELAHTKGFIREDEANFIAFLACLRSDDVYYKYAGCLSMLTYVRSRVFDYADSNKRAEFDSRICDEAWVDIDANREYWESVKKAEDTVFDSQTVSNISSSFVDNNLKANGVEDGSRSYGRVVDLMLNYFIDKNKK